MYTLAMSNIQQKKLAAIEGLKEYLSDLMSQRAKLDSDITTVQDSIRIMSGENQVTDYDIEVTESAYVNLKPQRAVELFFSEHPEREFTSRQITTSLKKLGARVPSMNSFSSQICAAVSRAAEKGIAKKTEGTGRKAKYKYCGGETESPQE